MALHRIRKPKLVWILILFLLLTNIHSAQIHAASINLSSTRSPLCGTSYKSEGVWIHNDISTSEILGVRRAGALLEYNSRTRRKQIHNADTYLPLLLTQEKDWGCGHRKALKQSFAIEIDSKYKIIRYIHDQDGEKDKLFHY